jgi:hypothetical protein
MKGLFAWIGYRQIPMLYEPDVRYAGASKWDYWKLWNLSIEGITSSVSDRSKLRPMSVL